jgi:hypothetical protein
MTTEESRERIAKFLDSGVWQVAADRTKTRRAIFEALSALPDALLAQIFGDLHILVIAPAQRRVATIVPYMCTVLAPLEAVQFSAIHLDSRIEAYDYLQVLAIVKGAFRHALASFLGVELPASGFEGEQSPNTDVVPREADADAGLKYGRPN